MLIVNLKIHKEGIVFSIASQNGQVWAEYYLTGRPAETVEDLIFKVIKKCEPIRGDKDTMKEYAKKRKREKK